MFKKKDIKNTGKVDTIVGKDVSLEGAVKGSGTIRIDGDIDGIIDIEGDLIIGETAGVRADVKAHNLLLAGHLRGKVEIQNKLELCSSGSLYGDVNTGTLVIQEGGYVQGEFIMTDDKNSKSSGPVETARSTKAVKAAEKEKNESDNKPA